MREKNRMHRRTLLSPPSLARSRSTRLSVNKSAIFGRSENGFPVVGLANSRIAIEVVPSLGARVLSLRDLHRNREWLWRPEDNRGLFRNSLGDAFERGPLAGIDECLPTVASCRANMRDLPDHGECWSRPWHLDEQSLEKGQIATTLELPLSPFHFERTISLAGSTIVLDYALTSRSNRPESFLWSLHPLLRLEPGDRIELPTDCCAPQVVTIHPKSAACAEVSLQPAGSHGSWIKAFVRAGNGRAALVRVDGARLSFEWEPKQLPWFGVWITRGGWNDFSHLALEPASGAPDDLSVAILRQECHATIAPAEAISWQLLLNVS